MPRQNIIQTSFAKGEVSPLARGRVDVNLYANGANRIENYLIRQQGALFRRSGTKYVRSTRFPTQQSVLVPFEVSDDQAYMLEFGVGYIHFYKNKEPLFNTTVQNEIDFFTLFNNNGDTQIAAFDHNSTFESALPQWTASTVADNGSGLIRLTFTTPHTARTGQIVYVKSAAYPTADGQYTITRISALIVDLQASTFNASMTNAVLYSHGVMAGDRIFISGANNFPVLTDSFQTVKSVEDYQRFTLANVPYVGNAITGIADDGTGNFRITSVAHGKANGENVTISDVTNYPNANGAWNIEDVTADTFDLDGSTFAGSGAVDGTWLPYPTMEEAHTIPIEILTEFTADDLADIRFAQSADVLYIVHPDYPPQKLLRLSDDGDRDDWLLADIDFTDGPYLPLNDASPLVDSTNPQNGAIYRDVYLDVTSYTHTATVTAAVAFAAAAADQNKYLEYREGDQWRLAQLTSASSSSTTGTVNIIENVLLYLDETTKLTRRNSSTSLIPGSQSNSPAVPRYRGNIEGNPLDGRPYQKIDNNDEVSSSSAVGGGVIAAGTIRSNFSNTFGTSDVGKFVRIHDSGRTAAGYWVQITGVSSTTGGNTATHAQSVAMVSNNATGKFVISAESRSSTLTAKKAGAAFSLFQATDVGRKIRIGFAGRWAWGTITTFTSASQVTVTWESDIPRDTHNAANLAGNQDGSAANSGITYDWRLGAWSDTTGWPHTVCFQEQRLTFGGTQTSPQAVWMSVSGDFENMIPTELDSTVLDDNAITYTLASSKANAIKWMVPGPALTIITNGGEWQFRAASSINDPITPSNINAKEYTNHGGLGSAQPARIGSSVVFVDRSGEKVHELFYSYENDALDSDDLTVISEHILREHSGGTRSVYQQKPHSIFWVLCADGTLSGMTYNKKQEVVAWHHHSLGDGTIESISVIPSEDGAKDELWMIVNRTINGAVFRSVEVLEADFYPVDVNTKDGLKFADGHVFYGNWQGGTTVSGLNHWEGETIRVMVNGIDQGNFLITNGVASGITNETGELLAGKPYSTYVESLPPEGGSGFGTSQGRTKRLVELAGRFMSQQQVTFGPDDTAANLFTQDMTDNIAPAVWFTGTYKMVPTNGYSLENGWYITTLSDDGTPSLFPSNILFVVSVLETNE